jgi:hypothetical protein
LLRRQAWEQYFTSAQFFAQRRRQVIANPQAEQGLLGNAALLPRKAALRLVTVTPRGRNPLENPERSCDDPPRWQPVPCTGVDGEGPGGRRAFQQAAGGQAPARPAGFVEQVHRVTGQRQHMRAGGPGDAGTDDREILSSFDQHELDPTVFRFLTMS